MKKLSEGSTIGIVSPSAPLAGLVQDRAIRGIKALERMGFKAKVGNNAMKVKGYKSGTAQERADDINAFFADDSIDAIFSFIGGNHSNQILEYLDFDMIRRNPKVFLGYSDITVLLLAIHQKTGMTTYYGPSVMNQFAEYPAILPYTEEYFRKCLMSDDPMGKIEPSGEWTDEVLDWFEGLDIGRSRTMRKNDGYVWLKGGVCTGKLIGGCISSLMHLRGTEYWPDFSGSIFFWEIPEGPELSKGESVYDIDSYLTDLKLSNVFNEISGMVIGRPFRYSEEEVSSLLEVIQEQFSGYDFPILFNADIGHTDPMITLPISRTASLDSDNKNFTIY
ncbi:MAG: LD-carboxypeptidase [Candidatus Pacebacteria bacterium]|nr:LD-carboxypeptidase [Candidatus Paceibacterota bacterium]